MFRSIRKKINSLLSGIRSAFTEEKTSVPSPDGEKNPTPRRSRGGNTKKTRADGEPYIRAADRRPASGSGRKKKENAAEPVPKAAKKIVAERTVPPMPELVPPPEEAGKLRFFDLELAPEILAATQTLGFQYCTPIQAKCLPYALAGGDLAAKAQTGTGKTAAFLASTMTRLLRQPVADRKPGTCRVLVLAPTRELAIQIEKDAADLGQYTNLYNLVIFGGMDHQGQRDALRKPVDVLAGTPGRIIDYSRSGHLDLSRTEILVIDEADRMLDMGFIPDVRRIVSQLPPAGKRQTMMFSATLDPAVLRLVESWLHNPVSLETEADHLITDLIDQHFYAVTGEHKLALLLSIIKTQNPARMLVFGNRKDHNRTLVKKLYAYGVDAELLSGDVAQEKRLKILEKFRSGAIKVLVATDVAARGIHVDGITHVVNYDLPEQPDDYVHRIGRTGRAGEKGVSISFVCEYGAYVLPDLEKYTKEAIHTVQPDDAMLVLPEKVRSESGILPDSDRPRRTGSFSGGGGFRGGRRSGSFGGRRR